jgi:Fe-S-cluster containining protein
MSDELKPIDPNDHFCFACHPQVSCFNQCCRDLNQALTPYDLLRLRSYLGISSHEFIRQYVDIHAGPASGLPVASLKFDATNDRQCPFVTEDGCRVYSARPSSCRLYPLARALYRSRADGSLSAHYAIIQESHCRGFEQQSTQKANDWIAAQGLEIYFRMNDALIELIALKNRLRPGLLPADLQHLTQICLYDLDTMKDHVASGKLKREFRRTQADDLPPAPDSNDTDEQWLHWSLDWLRRALFGKQNNADK